MEITIKTRVIEYLDVFVQKSIRFMYRWLTTDGEILSYILGIIHIICGCIFPLLVIISYTIYPRFWFQLLVFSLVLLLFLQHIFLQVCIFVVTEKKLGNTSESPYFKMMHDLLGINGELLVLYLVAFEFGVVLAMGLSILEKVIARLY
jgi:hypothetical protein